MSSSLEMWQYNKSVLDLTTTEDMADLIDGINEPHRAAGKHYNQSEN